MFEIRWLQYDPKIKAEIMHAAHCIHERQTRPEKAVARFGINALTYTVWMVNRPDFVFHRATYKQGLAGNWILTAWSEPHDTSDASI